MEIKETLDKLAFGKATAEEKENFSRWLGTLPAEAYKDVLLEWEKLMAERWAGGDFDETLMDDIHSRIMSQQESGKLAVIRTIRYGRWWTAAAVLLLLIGGIWWKSGLKEIHPPRLAEDREATHDILPGGNKAILTLADGSQIILDSAGNGAISRQGNVTIIKLNDGELSYSGKSGDPKESAITYNTISTPRGGQYQLILHDGTRVWLNAESSLRYPTSFTGGERKVELTGEGYFEVTRNEKMPFHVVTGAMDVKVLGTHFNVNAYSDEDDIRTTLLEGKVDVSAGAASAILSPGEQAQLQTDGNRLRTTDNVDLSRVVAWKDGFFSFERENIETIMHKIARWYDVDVVYEGKKPDGHFSGLVSRQIELSKVLYALETYGVKCRQEGRTVYIQ